jgi:hypothetical protein
MRRSHAPLAVHTADGREHHASPAIARPAAA